MDIKNPYESPVTFKLHRAEYLTGFAATITMTILHLGDIRWPIWLALFAYIDVIGYLPGAIAFRRNTDHRIPKIYYILYNSTHSLISCGIIAGLWAWLVRPEWALLAIPFHVLGDRGVFGNFLKPFGLPFEPVANTQYDTLVHALKQRSIGDRVPTLEPPDITPAKATR